MSAPARGYGRIVCSGQPAWAWIRDGVAETSPGDSFATLLARDAHAAPPPGSQQVDLETAQWALPLDASARILCVGVNYPAHATELDRPRPLHPSLFVRLASSLVPHGEPLVHPHGSAAYDYEGEIAIIIGRPVRHALPGTGQSAIAGYTCFGDHSARDFQQHSAQVTAGKNFDASGACGPWILAAAAVDDPATLQLETRVNGELRQSAALGETTFSPAALVEYVSGFMALRPGDVIATGTPAGIGWRQAPPRFLRPGDTVTVELVGHMALTNTVAAAV